MSFINSPYGDIVGNGEYKLICHKKVEEENKNRLLSEARTLSYELEIQHNIFRLLIKKNLHL